MRYNISFAEFLSKIDKEFYSASYKDQLRYGQIIMNKLYDVWPDKYAEITNTEYDCFYDNSKVKLALSKLEQEW